MRRARGLWVALAVVSLAGCFSTQEQRPRWTDPFDLFAPGRETDSASVHYVLIERPAGGDEINRRVWDRIDEQILPFETRVALEAAGLRVGKVGETMPGVLRGMFDSPRTSRGLRGRFFAVDKPFPLATTERLPKVDFPVTDSEGKRTRFVKEKAALGFEVTIREAKEGGVVVKVVPHTRFRDPTRLLLGELTDGDQTTELFPAAGFEIPLSANEYLVIGTDFYRTDTFGQAALIGDKDGEPAQRLMVLWAGLAKSPRTSEKEAETPPLSVQANTPRGARP
jgi:hypothetical protein